MTPAIKAAQKARIQYEILEYEHDPKVRAYGTEAAEILGVSPEAVFKTLVAKVDGALVAALVPVSCTLDLKALAQAHGGKRAEMADPAEAERATGYVVGGISPLGQRKALPTIIDKSASGLERIYVSAGRRGLEIVLRPSDLVALCRASLGKISRQ